MEETAALIHSGKPIAIGETIFFSLSEEHWDKPYPMKRNHIPETRSVILQAKLVEVKGNEMKIKLFGNNGFERDGGTYVFYQGHLLCNQNYTDTENLGKWKQNPSLN